jgi:ataxin-10
MWSGIHPARAPELTARYRDDEPVSPTQTTLLKLLDSFLHAVPTPFQDQGDCRRGLAGFLASAFLVQAEYAQRAIRQAIGEPPPGQNTPPDIRESTRTAAQTANPPLDGRLPGVWVALVLLSTSLSSILLAEQVHDGGTSPGPEVVTSSHDAIAASRSRAATGFIEELLGMMVPWCASISLYRPSICSQKPFVCWTPFSPASTSGRSGSVVHHPM